LKCAIAVGEGSSRLICLSQLMGIQELDVPLVVHYLRWFICVLGHGSFRFVPCIPPCLSALVFFVIDKGFIIIFGYKLKIKYRSNLAILKYYFPSFLAIENLQRYFNFGFSIFNFAN
jgi:hypothetical protein